VLAQALQEDDLAIGSLRVSGVVKCVEDLLDGDELLGAFIDSLIDNSISSFAQPLQHIILSQNVWFKFLSHR
jgi:hypothetical protein